ncbi:MAG: spondin domain-containing protein [Chloroflexota bacterium]
MKRLLFALVLLTSLAVAVSAQDDPEPVTFTVTIENIATLGLYDNAGAQAIPVDAEEAGPAVPGSAYEFTITPEGGQYLSFVTMFAQSNDLFFAPDADGIALFADDGTPFSGDVTNQVLLWDAGTEVNQPIGEGDQQAPRQEAPNTGDDENGVVTFVDNLDDGMSYPSTEEIISVNLTANDDGSVTVHIENISGDSDFASPITPVVWVVHNAMSMESESHGMMMTHGVFFTEGEADYGYGLEAVAEDGNPADLVATVAGGDFGTPIAPVVFAVHDNMMADGVFFTTGTADRGDGLEIVAEDGTPTILGEYATANYEVAGVSAIPSGAEEPGPALPGTSYTFTATAVPGESLSFVTMFVQSNDLFFAPAESGIALFDEAGNPISGNVADQVLLWDAGTEVNEEPGVGENQAPRQAEPNTGEDEGGVVRLVDDEFTYPNTTSVIRVLVEPDMMMGE